MACRLEEIPAAARLRRVRVPRPVGHRRAHRRHGGRRVPERLPPPRREDRRGRWHLRRRVPVPVPRLVLRARRQEHRGHPAAHLRRAQPGGGGPRPRRRCGARCGAGARGSTSTHDAPPVRESLEPAATTLDAWKLESMRAEKWYACRLPVNWKLAIEAFVEMYHVVQTHPQLVIPTRFGIREGTPFDPQAFIDADIQYLRAMSDGMDGMCHADDVRVAESLRDLELPADASLGDGHLEPHAQRRRRALAPGAGSRHARPQRARRAGDQPHVLPRLPALLRAADVQRRLRVPVPSVGTGGDADGDLVAGPLRRGRRARRDPRRPRCGSATTRAGRRSPRRTSRTSRASSSGCTRRASSTCACRAGSKGTSRTSSGPSTATSPAVPHEQLLPAVQAVNVYPFEQPILDLGF